MESEGWTTEAAMASGRRHALRERRDMWTSRWAYVVSNHGPLPCEGSALPLSYTPLQVMGLPYTAPRATRQGVHRVRDVQRRNDIHRRTEVRRHTDVRRPSDVDRPTDLDPHVRWAARVSFASASSRLAEVENHPDGEGSKCNGHGRRTQTLGGPSVITDGSHASGRWVANHPLTDRSRLYPGRVHSSGPGNSLKTAVTDVVLA